ncbi:MAG: SBBP repeat-containing protein [Bryobacteraceae bacterium]
MRCAFLLLLTAALASAARVPVAFEPNRGQEPGPAEFIARTSGAALALGPARAEWISRQARVAVVFESARRGVHGQGEQALPGVVNYLEGNQPSRWLRNIPTYSRVRYSRMYPGVDVVYYVNDGRLEYDLVLERGADPRRIRLHVEGAQSLHLDEAGDLVIATAGGELRQHRPIVYQDFDGQRRQVAASYQLRGREVRFALGNFDRSAGLVIDPALTWASYVLTTGALNTQAAGVALDPAGNSYTTGSVLASSGYYGCFVAKLNSVGTTVAYTYIGASPGDAVCNAIAVDSQGYIYVAGETDSAYLYADTSYLDYYPGYSLDAFVMKLNSSQSLYFSHYFGGSGTDLFTGIALDAADNVYLVGTTNSTDLPTSTGAFQTGLHGKSSNVFVVEFTSTGTGVYSTYLGGTGTDSGNAIAADAGGDAFVTGSTTSTNFPVLGPYQSALKGTTNAFVAKIGAVSATNNSVALIYSTYLGGNGNDEGLGIAVDKSGVVYVTGDTSSTNFPVTPGTYQSTYGGGTSDAFVAQLDGSGKTLQYATYLGGSGTDFGGSIAIDSAGNSYVTGGTSSTNFPITGDAFQSSNKGATNAFVAGLNPFLSGLLFSSYLGGSGTASVPTGTTNNGDFGTGVAVNCAAGLVVAGVTTSTDFPTTSGAATPSYPGVAPDSFVAQVGAGPGIPDISPGGIVNDASFSTGPVAPGSLVAIFGSGMAPFSQLFSGFPLTTSLSGVTVSVNGVNAPMFYAGWGQVNIQVPFETGAGTAVAIANNSCGSSGPVEFSVAQAAPYIFQNAAGQATAVLNQDYSVNSSTNPAVVGSYLQVYLTGIGSVSNPPADGSAASLTKLSPSTLPWSATISGWTSTSQYNFLGLAPGWVGLDQANVMVPGLSTGAYPLIITVGGVASNGPTVYVTQ